MFNKNKEKAPKAEKPKKEKVVKEKPPKKEKVDKKESKKKKELASSKIEQSMSQIAKDLGIRISNPYGYYPEDVDPILIDFRKTISDLEKENKTLADETAKAKENEKSANTAYSQLRMQTSIMSESSSDIENENQRLSQELLETQRKLKEAHDELRSLRNQIAATEIPDISTEEGFAMLSRIDSITGNYNSESVAELKQNNAAPQPRAVIKLKKPNS